MDGAHDDHHELPELFAHFLQCQGQVTLCWAYQGKRGSCLRKLTAFYERIIKFFKGEKEKNYYYTYYTNNNFSYIPEIYRTQLFQSVTVLTMWTKTPLEGNERFQVP